MRYLTAFVALVLAGVAVVAVVNYSPRKEAAVDRRSVAQGVPAEASAQPVEETTVAQPPPPMTRERAIALGASVMTEMGELDPRLVSVRRTTYRRALLAVRRDPAFYLTPENDVPGDREVWVAIFRGTYHAQGRNPDAQRGIGYAIMDHISGNELSWGYGGGTDMLTPGPPLRPNPPPKR